MKRTSLTITGSINKKGQHGFYNINQLEDFAKQFPNMNTIITIQVEEKGKKGILSYYHAKVLPDWQWELYHAGQIMSIKEVDLLLKKDFPLLQRKSLSDLTYQELLMYIDYVKHRSLEEINIFIESPHVL